MKINHFDIKHSVIQAPPGWSVGWHGNLRKDECKSASARRKFHAAQDKAHSLGVLGEREFEVDCFLSILQDIKKPKIHFVELGAGYAEWCCALDGVIKHRLIPIIPYSYQALAVEAEPTHYQWACEHFKTNNIVGAVHRCAVSDRKGFISFSVGDAATNYGQGIVGVDGPLRGFRNRLSGKTERVRCVSFDELLKDWATFIPHADLVHVDVQGAETKVILGAMESVKAGKVSYWLIGTHRAQHNENIRRLLLSHYELVVDVEPRSIGGADGLKALCGDGVMVWKQC